MIDKLTLLLVDHVVVTDKLLITLSLAHFVRLGGDPTGYKGVTDTNEPFLNKVHLINFLVLVINDVVVEVVLEAAG